MNYKEKYNKLVEAVKKLQEANPSDEGLHNWVNDNVPELKESDDERIRKRIIHALHGDVLDMEETTKAIAWLEKQKEFVSEDFDDVWETADCDELTAPLEKYSKDAIKEMCHAWYDKGIELERRNWLEKQGEQKITDKYNIRGIKSNHAEGKLGEMIKEIKSTDKVEPKFKVGDWIIDIQGVSINQIIGYEDDSYLIKTSCSPFYLPIKLTEKNYRLWTIQDAKDGDILYTPKGLGVEGIFLIKGWEQVELTGKTLCSSIGYRVEENEIVVSGLGAIWWEGVKDPFFPATKEQRELLFHKMKEAGYEWDVDKKELKKIKDEIEIQFGAKDSELQEDTYYIPKGFHAEIDKDKVVIKMGKKPTEWSEKYIADVFEKVGLAKIVREQSNDALTIALQDAMIELSKVTLQPKPTEWSEEDEGILDEIIDFLENGTVKLQHDLSLYASWLKSLKDRYAWKPNDEQMEEEKPRYNIGDIICDKSCTTLNKEAQPNMEIVDIRNGMYICDKGSFPVSQQDEYELVGKKIDLKPVDSVSNELRTASFAHAKKELKNPTCPDNEELELIYTFEEGAKWNAAQHIHAWSEEDENIKEWIMSDINKLLALNRKSFVIADKEITWLKSLKGRVGCEVNCTTTKECSVEDMSKIQRICKYLDEAKKYYTNITEVRECIDWLKSLKDRYTWKPSDEQLFDFKVIAKQNEHNMLGKSLMSLYNDLLKLKE